MAAAALESSESFAPAPAPEPVLQRERTSRDKAPMTTDLLRRMLPLPKQAKTLMASELRMRHTKNLGSSCTAVQPTAPATANKAANAIPWLVEQHQPWNALA